MESLSQTLGCTSPDLERDNRSTDYHSEGSDRSGFMSNNAGDLNSNIDTDSSVPGLKPSILHDCNPNTAQKCPEHIENQVGFGQPPLLSTMNTNTAISDQPSRQHDHNPQQYVYVGQSSECDASMRVKTSQPMQNESSEIDKDLGRYHQGHRKKRRWTDESEVLAAEARQLEYELTKHLFRPHGRAGIEILEDHQNLDATSLHLLDTIPPRYAMESYSISQLQNFSRTLHRAGPRREDQELYSQIMSRIAIEKIPLESPSSLAWYPPPLLPLGSNSVIFLSEVLPRSLDQAKRSELLKIFRTRAPYIPWCISLATGLRYGIQYHVCNLPKTVTSSPGIPLGPSGRGWPQDTLPFEVFQIIGSYLPRDSLQNMRFVNREFESKISNIIFNTVVVPFRREIYGIMVQHGSIEMPIAARKNGQVKELLGLPLPNKNVHDGMRTFQSWGPHIKRFAMAFEVEETTLEKPPIKGRFQTHGTFWGRYKWPHPHYHRYEYCEGLEKQADEFRCMSAALSNLTNVTELALSIDNGLGWLNGPDISDRAHLLREKPRIFGRMQQFLDTSEQELHRLWDDIQRSASESSRPWLPARGGFYEVKVEWQPKNRSSLPRRMELQRQPRNMENLSSTNRPLIFGGVDIRQVMTSPNNQERSSNRKSSTFQSSGLNPKALSNSQKEWLLEIEWAQRAFISSFCMALSDNSQTFRKVTTLNFARISSRYLPSLQRNDFWEALQNLTSLTFKVSADWRDISKAASGQVDAQAIQPSKAAIQFHDILQSHISCMKNTKVLEVGYVGGGEDHAGIYGRNKHILPAPVVAYVMPLSSIKLKDVLIFQHVEKLTLTNCWFPPQVFTKFCIGMRLAKLKTLDLKSISLCYHSKRKVSTQKLGTELDIFSNPQGNPRYDDLSVGNFFHHRPVNGKDPQPDSWVNNTLRIGSWGQVIDRVTPGADLDFVRYAYQYYDRSAFKSLNRAERKSFERITFESCGYVYLYNQKAFDQGELATNVFTAPPCLVERAANLLSVSMQNLDDRFLGQICPHFPPAEKEVLETGFPMTFGWADTKKAAECLEDAQPMGGTGRFSGKVERLTFPNLH